MIYLIVNAHAKGMTTPDARTAFVELAARELPHASVSFAERGEDVPRLTLDAIAAGATIIVAGGGDGTVNAVAGLLMDTEVTLGVLPFGTLNHFARDVGMPEATEDALRVFSGGRVVDVDVGEVNGRIFLNNTGLGLYPEMVHQREQRQQKGAGKWTSAIREGLRALMRYRLLGVRIVLNGETLLRRTPAVMVGNNEYVLQGLVAPTRARLDAGMLSLYVPHPRARLTLVWFAFRALFWRSFPDDRFDLSLTDSLTIESRRHQLRVSLDGEVTTMAPPLTYRSRRKALRVMVPEPTV